LDFSQGSISNRDYERRFPKSKNDPALLAIYSNTWFSYSDTSEHTLSGKHALKEEQRATVERCILFLRSNLEFQWPVPKFRLRYALLRLLGFGRALEGQEKQEMSIGDVDVWPFFRRAEYEQMSSQ